MKNFGKILALLSLASFVACTTNSNQPEEGYAERETLLKHGILRMYRNTHSTGAELEDLDPKAVARGKVLYQQNCMRCHGADGLGDGPLAPGQHQKPANLAELAHDIPDFKFFMKISRWNDNMPGWNEPFTPKQNGDLEAFLKSLGREYKESENLDL